MYVVCQMGMSTNPKLYTDPNVFSRRLPLTSQRMEEIVIPAAADNK